MTTKNYIRLGIASICMVGLLSISNELSQFQVLEESEYYKRSLDLSFQIDFRFFGGLLIGVLLLVTMYYLIIKTDLSNKIKNWIFIFTSFAFIIVGVYGGISSFNYGHL
jgi:hypothetical protein